MISATGGTQGTYNSESYTYNSSTGNLASKGGVSYTYGDSDHKHAVTSLSNGWTYQYDQNGNMTERNVDSSTYSLTYDAYNHLISVSGAASVDFVYDGDGQRVKVGGTVYIGDYYRYYGSGCTKFYFANGKRIALRFNTGSQANNYYYLSDHLNSSTVLVNAARSYIGREGYKAWGETRFGGVGLHFKFTGEYYVSNIGLYHFGARFYDPALGRFTQADTLVPEGVQGSQAWDRYAYVNNNPLRYTDPSGHDFCDENPDNPSCAEDPNDYFDYLREEYGWRVEGDYSVQEARDLFMAHIIIRNGINSRVSAGNGDNFIRNNLSGITFHHGIGAEFITGLFGAVGMVPGYNHVYMNTNSDSITIIHEIGHVLDNYSKRNKFPPSTWFGGGAADILALCLGGNPNYYPTHPRFMNGTSGIMEVYQMGGEGGTDGYGNIGTAEFFAEAFKYFIIDNTLLKAHVNLNMYVLLSGFINH